MLIEYDGSKFCKTNFDCGYTAYLSHWRFHRFWTQSFQVYISLVKQTIFWTNHSYVVLYFLWRMKSKRTKNVRKYTYAFKAFKTMYNLMILKTLWISLTCFDNKTTVTSKLIKSSFSSKNCNFRIDLLLEKNLLIPPC